MKVVRNIIVLICIFISLPSYAQKEDWKDMVRKNIELKDKLVKAVSDTISLSQMNNDFKKQIYGLDEHIATINQQIEDIQFSFDPKNVSAVTLQVDSLAKVEALLNSTKSSLSNELYMLKKQQTDRKSVV